VTPRQAKSEDAFVQATGAVRMLTTAMDSLVMPVGPPWPTGSRIAREVAEDVVYTGRWGTRPIQDAALDARAALLVAEDHLLGIAALIEAPDIVAAPLSLGRTVLAAAARAFWQLDPDIDARERLRRAMNVRLHSYRERSGLLEHEDVRDRERLGRLLLDIIQTAPRHGFEVKQGKAGPGGLWPLRWLDEPLPKEMQLVERLFHGLGEQRTGTLAYRYGSAVVHAQPHGLGMLEARVESAAVDGVVSGRVGITSQQLARYLVGPLFGVHLACQRFVEHVGGRVRTWDRAVQPALRTWAALMGS